MKIEYLNIAFAVFAVFGIQLIEPNFANTVKVSATHLSLKFFYQELYHKMEDEVTKDFFELNTPWFNVFRQGLFDVVKTSYNLSAFILARCCHESYIQ